MNTAQIERILRRDPYCKKIFKGVYARDQIKRVSYPSAYIINSDPSTRPGRHWIAVFFDRRGNGQYFDSYGLPPKVLGFTEFMNRNSKKWIWNRKTLQGLYSAVCGQYCIYFVLLRCRGVSLRSVTSHFSSNFSENDRRIARFIRNLYNHRIV